MRFAVFVHEHHVGSRRWDVFANPSCSRCFVALCGGVGRDDFDVLQSFGKRKNRSRCDSAWLDVFHHCRLRAVDVYNCHYRIGQRSAVDGFCRSGETDCCCVGKISGEVHVDVSNCVGRGIGHLVGHGKQSGYAFVVGIVHHLGGLACSRVNLEQAATHVFRVYALICSRPIECAVVAECKRVDAIVVNAYWI